MREGLIIFTLFSVLLVGETIAEPAEGAYLGAKFGLTHNQHSCGESAVKCDRRDIGSGLFAGYDFNRRYAAEISVFNLGGSSATYPNVDLEGELFAADATLKYSRHFLSESRIFAKLGVAYWKGEVKGWGVKLDGSGFTPTVGAGLAIPLSERWNARIEYQYFDTLGTRAMGYTQQHFLSLGLTWHFTNRNQQSSAALLPAPPIVEKLPSPPPPPAVPALPEQINLQPSSTPIVVDDDDEGPLFAYDSAVLDVTPGLKKIADALRRNPELSVRIVGHTDDRGASSYNLRLSKARANSVAEYLKSQGVSETRIRAVGEGEDRPVADNNTDKGRAQNRRVEFFISLPKNSHN